MRMIDPALFQKALLHWYHRNKRSMPWRDDPTPYHVWISEIMLQQTRVDAVRGHYVRFIERLPDVKSLAEADDDELHKLWEGLGYYSRAKNLKKAAGVLMRDYHGELPADFASLRKLPGIGPYTAGAICSIAFHMEVPAVDGNVMRVLSRLTGDSRDISLSETRRAMEDAVRRLIPPGDAHHFNQALMELGATICIPNGSPRCDECPVGNMCHALETGTQLTLPLRPAKKARRIEARTVLLFVNENKEFYIQKRPETGLLAGLWQFPSIPGELYEPSLRRLLKESGVSVVRMVGIESAKHVFTHLEWHMRGYLIVVDSSGARRFVDEKRQTGGDPLQTDAGVYFPSLPLSPGENSAWCGKDALRKDYGIPSAFRTYIRSIESGAASVALCAEPSSPATAHFPGFM